MSDCCNDFEFVCQQNSFDMSGGIRGADGTTFYPHVSADGVLSWTNDGGKPNPDPVNIKGADGTPGKSAYAAAQEAGFSGTEAEFNAYLSGIGDLTQEVADQKSAIEDLEALTDRKAGMLVDTASGAIASFVPDATIDNLLGVSVAVEPVQDLHGYDAPWPAGSGKNKLPVTATTQTINGVTFTVNSDGTINVNGTAAANATLVVYGSNASSAADITIEGESVISTDTSAITGVVWKEGGGTTFNTGTYTISAGAVLYGFGIRVLSGVTANNIIVKPMLRLSTESATYAPYSNICPISGWDSVEVMHSGADTSDPNTYTITLGQTVYGGTLDVTSGKMYARPFFPSYNGEALIGPWISSIDAYTPGATPTVGAQVVDMGGTITEIALDPVTISTISGQTNNVWADAGVVTVEFAADIKAYIDRLNQPIEEDMIANTLIASGKYFTVNNRLFLSTASIAAGAQIIPDTNCTETSLVEALNALNA